MFLWFDVCAYLHPSSSFSSRIPGNLSTPSGPVAFNIPKVGCSLTWTVKEKKAMDVQFSGPNCRGYLDR
jgi:hypothetical protein